MNNKIEPHYVDFATSKGLKEKGFDVPCKRAYRTDGAEYDLTSADYRYGINSLLHLIDTDTETFEYPNLECSAPEQWQVVEWLRVNHGIWVEVTIYRKDNRNYMQYSIFYFPSMDSRVIIRKDDYRRLDEFNSPQETYSAAFDYILNNNLI
jgi:hypothetical protein